ncbi:MAG: hypothetical protein IPP62_01410 [bacterium]|nr:hypothetical protein [bacterium]
MRKLALRKRHSLPCSAGTGPATCASWKTRRSAWQRSSRRSPSFATRTCRGRSEAPAPTAWRPPTSAPCAHSTRPASCSSAYLIRKAIAACDGRKAAAARRLGLSRQGLYKKIARYGMLDLISTGAG